MFYFEKITYFFPWLIDAVYGSTLYARQGVDLSHMTRYH